MNVTYLSGRPTTIRVCGPTTVHDGFAEQWKELAKDPKVAGHTIFKMLRSEEFYLYKHNSLLSGMLRYHYLVHWHAADLSHEAISRSLLMMAHVYMGTQLRTPPDPVWPDMEFMLFSQDPRYALLKRPAETPEEAPTLFDLATGQPTVKKMGPYALDRLNLSRGDLGLPKYDACYKSRLFRDASVLGDTVYLPKGSSGCWIKKILGGAFNGKINIITTALLAVSDLDAMQASREKQGLNLEPINVREGLTSVAILQHFAFWLQADMPDFCFNGSLMQRQCSDAWKVIYVALERDPAWDGSWSQFGQSPQHAADAIISTSELVSTYSRFMEIARNAMRNYLQRRDSELQCLRSEVCLTNMMKYHKRTAKLFTDDGPLSVDILYRNWTATERQTKRETIAATAAQAEVVAGNADLQEMFQASAMRGMSRMVQSDNAEDCMVM